MFVFAVNFRGFKEVEVDLDRVTFLVGDNSSGKSSILHLVDCVSRSDLSSVPRMNEEFGVSEFDFFSPYFDYADVTFGFCEEEDGNIKFAKLLTLRRADGEEPAVISCSYYFDSMLITLRQEGDNYKKRIMEDVISGGKFDLALIHNSLEGFELVEVKNYVPINDTSALFEFGLLDDNGFRENLFKVATFSTPSVRLISPIRALPEKFYSFSRKISTQGSHFASVLIDFEKSWSHGPFENAKKFGKESALFDNLKVQRVSKDVPNSPLVVSIVKSGKKFFLNQVGVGVSQVVPVLVETTLALTIQPNLAVLVQQPELHLHPVAQSALGSYLFRMAKKNLRGVFETHSSFLLDRFRSEVKSSNKRAKNTEKADSIAVILFCENSNSGNRITEVNISKDGSLVGEPDSYHQFFVDELLRTMS